MGWVYYDRQQRYQWSYLLFNKIINTFLQDLTKCIFKSPPTMWWWRLIVLAESTRRRRHLFLLSLENPYSVYPQIYTVCILALGNLSGNFFFAFFQFL